LGAGEAVAMENVTNPSRGLGKTFRIELPGARGLDPGAETVGRLKKVFEASETHFGGETGSHYRATRRRRRRGGASARGGEERTWEPTEQNRKH